MSGEVIDAVHPDGDLSADELSFAHRIRKFADNDIIEVAPLAYMRGRTLSDAFIILDEG